MKCLSYNSKHYRLRPLGLSLGYMIKVVATSPQLKTDYCCYIRREGEKFVILLVWVDDILILTNSPAESDHVEAELKSKYDIKALGHLFAYHHKNGHRPLTKSKFLTELAKAARAAGLEPLQGHGIRIGSTLEYLLRGVPFDVMKVKGCWSSDAFTLYLRKHAQILAPYIQAVPAIHDTFARLTMPAVR